MTDEYDSVVRVSWLQIIKDKFFCENVRYLFEYLVAHLPSIQKVSLQFA